MSKAKMGRIKQMMEQKNQRKEGRSGRDRGGMRRTRTGKEKQMVNSKKRRKERRSSR